MSLHYQEPEALDVLSISCDDKGGSCIIEFAGKAQMWGEASPQGDKRHSSAAVPDYLFKLRPSSSEFNRRCCVNIIDILAMFVLPPPPARYPNAGLPGGPSLLETNNTLEHPTGQEYHLVTGEGTYVLRDDLHLATPPPHPSDIPLPNNNPLAPSVSLPEAGTKLTLVSLGSKQPPSRTILPFAGSRSQLPASIQEEVSSPKSDAGSTNGFGTASYYIHTPGFGDNNPALQPPPAKAKKDQKLKPKNNIVKSNSSYVSRVIPHDTLPKRLSERSSDGVFAFANVNRALLWLDLSSDIKVENLTKVLFTKAHVIAHDVNPLTKSISHLDVILGFNTSDIIWYEPVSQKYSRLNKNGVINASPITAISWLPNKENLFMAAHQDGTLIIYDKDKEDAEFVPEEIPKTTYVPGGKVPRYEALKSVQSRNQKTNPVAYWKVSNMCVNNFAFSPDGMLLAVVSSDGCLTVIDYINERVLDVHRSYFGALLCVTWSPDSQYVLTGGEDDLVSIWSIPDRTLVARCTGHDSWVTDVKFDPWRCDERTYRFGSVGADCRLLLWDFSVGMLAPPKAATGRMRGSVSGHTRKESSGATRLRSGSNLSQPDGIPDEEEDEIVHGVISKAHTARLPAVMSKKVDNHPLSWVGFEEHCIITSCIDGHIREWDRPKEGVIDDASTEGSLA